MWQYGAFAFLKCDQKRVAISILYQRKQVKRDRECHLAAEIRQVNVHLLSTRFLVSIGLKDSRFNFRKIIFQFQLFHFID